MLHSLCNYSYEAIQDLPSKGKVQPNEVNPNPRDALLHQSLRLPPIKQEDRQHRQLDSYVYVISIDLRKAQEQRDSWL
jgi:hypothetical protein